MPRGERRGQVFTRLTERQELMLEHIGWERKLTKNNGEVNLSEVIRQLLSEADARLKG